MCLLIASELTQIQRLNPNTAQTPSSDLEQSWDAVGRACIHMAAHLLRSENPLRIWVHRSLDLVKGNQKSVSLQAYLIVLYHLQGDFLSPLERQMRLARQSRRGNRTTTDQMAQVQNQKLSQAPATLTGRLRRRYQN